MCAHFGCRRRLRMHCTTHLEREGRGDTALHIWRERGEEERAREERRIGRERKEGEHESSMCKPVFSFCPVLFFPGIFRIIGQASPEDVKRRDDYLLQSRSTVWCRVVSWRVVSCRTIASCHLCRGVVSCRALRFSLEYHIFLEGRSFVCLLIYLSLSLCAVCF